MGQASDDKWGLILRNWFRLALSPGPPSFSMLHAEKQVTLKSWEGLGTRLGRINDYGCAVHLHVHIIIIMVISCARSSECNSHRQESVSEREIHTWLSLTIYQPPYDKFPEWLSIEIMTLQKKSEVGLLSSSFPVLFTFKRKQQHSRETKLYPDTWYF